MRRTGPIRTFLIAALSLLTMTVAIVSSGCTSDQTTQAQGALSQTRQTLESERANQQALLAAAAAGSEAARKAEANLVKIAALEQRLIQAEAALAAAKDPQTGQVTAAGAIGAAGAMAPFPWNIAILLGTNIVAALAARAPAAAAAKRASADADSLTDMVLHLDDATSESDTTLRDNTTKLLTTGARARLKAAVSERASTAAAAATGV